jgi:hypothetical protein
MQTRILVMVLAASVLAAPLHGAEAGPLKNLVKLSVFGNKLFAKKALKGAADLTKKSIQFNAAVARCAVDIVKKKPC